ncbi:IS701 family transposase [Candidatus Gracilibacteria bacterium]|nr:IS701 family transposase [Candidatus Gracilibacteria bacterium]
MTDATVPVLTLTPTDVADLADALRPYHAIYGDLFPRSESRGWAERYLHGLLSPLDRKSVEPMVIAQLGASERAVRGMQQFLTDSTWDDAAILHRHWQEVARDLDDADGILIVDGSDVPKKGQHSVGVKRQYCGQLGKIANCQAGVFLAYASAHGTTLLDRRLYLPQEWVADPAFAERRAKTQVPADVRFQTKNDLALTMIQDVVASQALTCRWLLADEAFGRDTALLDAIAALALWYMVEIPLDTRIVRPDAATTPQTLFDTLPAAAWHRHLVGDGTKGRRIAETWVQRVQAQRAGQAGPDVWLILRIDPESGEQKAFLSNAPATLAVSLLVRMTGMRWPIEQCFEVAKQQLGMGDYEVRSWPGWHHHMTLVILAHFFLVRLQRRLKKSPVGEPVAGRAAAQRAATAATAHGGPRARSDRLLPPTARVRATQSPPPHRTLDRQYGHRCRARHPARCTTYSCMTDRLLAALVVVLGAAGVAPTTTLLEVTRLALPGLMIELEGTAVAGRDRTACQGKQIPWHAAQTRRG